LTSESAATTVAMRSAYQEGGEGAGRNPCKQEVWRESREIVRRKRFA
jgi:hypothetical protein